MLQVLTGQPARPSLIPTVEEARADPRKFMKLPDPRAGPWPMAEALAFADLAMKCVEYQCVRGWRGGGGGGACRLTPTP